MYQVLMFCSFNGLLNSFLPQLYYSLVPYLLRDGLILFSSSLFVRRRCSSSIGDIVTCSTSTLSEPTVIARQGPAYRIASQSNRTVRTATDLNRRHTNGHSTIFQILPCLSPFPA